MKSLLQTQEWASLKQEQGWQVHWVDKILILEKKLVLGLSFLYVPEADFFQVDFEKNLIKIKEIARNSKSIFLRFDFLNQKNNIFGLKFEKILKNYRFIKSFEEIQPEYRQILDVSMSEEQILAQMKPKGRYNIRVAEKHNVVVEKSENIDDFYKVFRQTAERDGFSIRPKKYFENLLKKLKSANLAEMLICRYNNEVVAAGIFTFHDDWASYLYGASNEKYRQTMAPYLMHWEAIKLAKAKGCKIYDFLAIAPFGSDADQKLALKYEGITRFKKQFGGSSIQTLGSWDLVFKPFWYFLFKFVEKIRRK